MLAPVLRGDVSCKARLFRSKARIERYNTASGRKAFANIGKEVIGRGIVAMVNNAEKEHKIVRGERLCCETVKITTCELCAVSESPPMPRIPR